MTNELPKPTWDDRAKLMEWTFSRLDAVFDEGEYEEAARLASGQLPLPPTWLGRRLIAVSKMFAGTNINDADDTARLRIAIGELRPLKGPGNPTFVRNERAHEVASIAKTITLLWRWHGWTKKNGYPANAAEIAAVYCYRNAGLEPDEDDIADLVEQAEAVIKKGPKKAKKKKAKSAS